MKGLLLIYLMTGVGTIGGLANPLIGLFVYVMFAVLRPQAIWGFAGDMNGLSRLVGVVTLLSWAFRSFGDRRIGRGRVIVASLLMFTLWMGLSALQATNTDESFAAVTELAKVVLPFLVGITLLNDEKYARWMMWTIVLSQGYVGFEMNWTYLTKGYNAAGEGFAGMDNNCLGVSLVSVIGPAMALGLAAKTWRGRALAAASVALILHATLLTYSRGAMVGLLGVALTAFIIMPKSPKFVGAVVVVGLLALRLTGPQLMARYATAVMSEEEGGDLGEGRLDLWLDCLAVLKSKPLFGVGPWNWRVVASQYGWTNGKSAHSVWMETAAETGAPGVLSLLSFFGLTALYLWPVARQRLTPENRYEMMMASGIIMGVAGFAISGQFVSLAGLEVPYYVAMVGVVLLKLKSRQQQAAPALARSTTPRLAMAGPPMRPAIGGIQSRAVPR